MLTGILLALATGLVFMFIGIVFSYAGTRVNMLDVLFFQNLFLTIVFLAFALPIVFSFSMLLPILVMAIAGAVNVWAMLTMQKSMALGNSGVSWAIAQSAFVGPYLGSLLFLGEAPTLPRVAGVTLILGGMAMLGIFSKKSIDAQSNSGQGKYRWLMLAFLAFGLLVVAMYCVTASSYWSVKIDTALRSGSMTFGALLFVVGVKAAHQKYRFQLNRRAVVSILGLTTLGLGAQSIIFFTVDALSQAGAAGIGYPVINGSCITLYFLYSTLVLKEKNSLGGKLAVASLVTGILLLCFS